MGEVERPRVTRDVSRRRSAGRVRTQRGYTTMANRRKFLAGLGALATGSAAAMGTSAFSQTTADRAISVTVSGDASAYIGLEKNDSFGEYAEFVDDQLVLTLDGISQDAEALYQGLFTITNNIPDTNDDIRVSLIKRDESGNEILGGTNGNGKLVSGERVRFFGDWSYPPEESDRIDKIGDTIRVGYVDIPTGNSVDVAAEISTGDSAPGGGPSGQHYLQGKEFADDNPAANDVLMDEVEILAQQFS